MIGIGIVCKYSFNTYNPYETKCVEPECNNERVEESIYCKDHKPSKEDAELDDCLHDMVPYVEDTTEEKLQKKQLLILTNIAVAQSSYSSSSNSYGGSSSYSGSSSSSPYKSYDEGYEAVYDDDDYDWDRYNSRFRLCRRCR